MTTIAFIGLGAMGRPMAGRLIAAGHAVRGYDLNPVSLRWLQGAGGQAGETAAEAARGAEIAILMVVGIEQAREVLWHSGVADALGRGSLVILMATCPPQAVTVLADEVTGVSIDFLDAPVSGGVVGATEGRLTIMAAGPPATFARARPILDQLGDKVFHVGPRPGQGATVKTVNQLLCGVHLAAAAEALSLAIKAGVEPAIVLEILGGSAASSWMLRDRGPRMLEDEPAVASAVDIFVKDLGIVLDAGRGAKAALPLAAAAHQMFLAASGLGHGPEDDSRVLEAYRALNGGGT